MNEKNILLAARVVSLLFTPYYLPAVGLIALFTFSYLSMLPRGYQLTMLLIVYLSTVLFPTLLLHAYRQYTGWSPIQFGHKERRVVPYVISILCYFLCYYLMLVAHVPHVINSIVVAALAIQIICALINIGWGVSSHTAAIGGVTGGLLAFSLIFNFNPVWWLCVMILLAGIVATSRMILRQHTLAQVLAGFFLGLVTAFFIILLV